ncbi:MAG TPA: 16S rRNA (cytidine(1402)-2'-O)-methyltransferase [Chitinophagaceae bacterium]|nr:16S rRNA (cytidine(1402)-2'-O)-methyltransferase [Chitinophagaceae bacterium]
MKLFLVPSPLGNLQDITLRAISTLKECDLILAEDTRTSGVLLRHFGISRPITPYHSHNEHRVTAHLVQQLRGGMTMALLTDAGTPGVSDPGYLLVRACIQAGIPVECLPGPSAFLPALAGSGIPMNRFCFEGFLPLKKGRATLLKQLALESRTMVFYESPLRLPATLRDFEGCFGPQRACSVARELTKVHEEHVRGTIREVLDHFTKTGVRGECVIIVGGNPE